MPPSPGWKFCTYRCAQDVVALLTEYLRTRDEVDPKSIRPTATGIAFTIELVRLQDNGGGPAAEQRIMNAFDRIVSRHRLPSIPPPK